MIKVLILGANGFIGSHLVEAILATTDWQVAGLDLHDHHIKHCLLDTRFDFKLGDMRRETAWLAQKIKECDVVLPLAAIATPARYVKEPLSIFELDFEANLAIVRLCVAEQKRIIFPSTSEVYGMCQDLAFDEESSHLVTGPINKERWIYSTSKQLLDRLIYAYGKHAQLNYTLFRPFNWYGARLDNIFNEERGGSRVLTQFIGNIIRGENIYLVDGGAQQRCFTYIDDGIGALLKIIANREESARNQIFNLGNPKENLSIRTLAEKLISLIVANFPAYAALASKVQLVDMDAKTYYGAGYQDVTLRVPSIARAQEKLAWYPETGIDVGLLKTLASYLLPGNANLATTSEPLLSV